MSKFYVYIINSDKGFTYIGQTNDLPNRNKATKSKGRWEIVAYKTVATRSEAITLESKLKRMKSCKKAIEYLNKLVKSIPTKSGGS
jgi:predicted GIY-YIG superfamily endonuclease